MTDLVKLINEKKSEYSNVTTEALAQRKMVLDNFGIEAIEKILTEEDTKKKLIAIDGNKDYLITMLQKKTKHYLGYCDGGADDVHIILKYKDGGYKHGRTKEEELKFITAEQAEEISKKIFEYIREMTLFAKSKLLKSEQDYVDLEKEFWDMLVKKENEIIEKIKASNKTSDKKKKIQIHHARKLKNNFFSAGEKYEKVYMKMWFIKYLYIVLEEANICSFYTDEWHTVFLKKFNITSHERKFIRNVQVGTKINELSKETGVDKYTIFRIFSDEFGDEYEAIKNANKSENKDDLNSDKETHKNSFEKETKMNLEQENSDELKPYLGKNVIFYGVPGCGKSRFIKELLDGIDKCYYKRILFHPEYSYGDFIGQIIPTLDKDNKPTYEFKEGPMLQMLKLANDNEEKQFFLIIEEINRGNAPAIFGDFFQLLDRNGGKSEYSINNAEIEKKLNKKEIEIPKNLTILATMNTCDQNVFTLDTAFKRRFRMTRIKNSFDKVELVIKGKDFEIKWSDLGPAINTAIVEKCNDGVSSEDKQLGAYFVHGEEIDIREFAEKVLMYLWDDVVKYDKQQLFKSTYKTLDSLIDAFCEGKNVFADSCADIKSIYDQIEEEKAKKAEEVSEIKPEEEKETPEE